MFAGKTFDKAAITSLFRAIVDAGKTGRFADYSSAEQAAMAIGSLSDAML